ncbi:hypothetical protein N7466_009769 [Penicillium verhagenii]|uniref:uncharacterized protein n=1 Tax=Penicillium verhagenii TaxID=1562060 RepID=UPI0025454174|nr:uncharacterized protein N7466_009769 [Penicillium verhagenii]KAJ5921443.1 hypothetical protein N7466_009769 [Penicillium verhagenii]
MFRSAFRPIPPLRYTKTPCFARNFYWVTTDFIAHDERGNPVTRKVPIIIGDPEQNYVLIEQEVGSALRAASSLMSASAAISGDSCKLTFFHDSQHFGFESPSYPRLHVPRQMHRQTESNTSPATLLMAGKMHELVIDGTPDGIIQPYVLPIWRILIHNAYLAIFAQHTNNSARSLGTVLEQLKDM